ncbi:hypothetical protein O163_05515 [Caldanaerobacter subterraneus subsp. yonseiensis KB-1]|uniref:Uncharacterized protein n=1 Tax=Caldanaerobacter subterraneus subsp. yonseiensis KB-1 TaxID=1388761 RepID=U5CHI3_CALSX|nr:hypothetical protein O163_05515 [Caldanaerobacter subterraneus subsp. yonseiensis KB-1]
MRRVLCFFKYKAKEERRRRKMLSKKEDARHQIEFISIDQLIPQDHF